VPSIYGPSGDVSIEEIMAQTQSASA